MIISSDFKRDFPSHKPDSGSYEWWYFDAYDQLNDLHIVIIFYDGCPFSPEYIDRWENTATRNDAKPHDHPAISISVYKGGETVFYSLKEYLRSDFSWDDQLKKLQIGSSGFILNTEGQFLSYILDLDELLPGGDRFRARLTFSGNRIPENLFANSLNGTGISHEWNLSMPSASVTGKLEISGPLITEKIWEVNATGYHDHNLGREPMKEEFNNWYWGRVHMPSGTLIYYIMNRRDGSENRAWFIGRDNVSIDLEFGEVELSDFRSNIFLLNCARKVVLRGKHSEVTLQMRRLVDSGPFYYRFLCDAILESDSLSLLESSGGISEFIHPARIHSRLFRPLVRMRYTSKGREPHWVQKNPRLYRWTW
jgi:carotenoid 1,2-hydratase